RGLQELFVVEEKRSFVETFIREALYNQSERPLVIGKQDEQDRPLVPANGELDADRIALLLATRLEKKINLGSITARVALLEALRERPQPITLARQPYFCSGCPHNRSTAVPEGSMAAAGIGCHGMALSMPERRTMGITHMGGEGAQWVGMAPFSNMPHMFQNLGDGTFFHSGSLAIRQAIAAGTNVTFKILYNSAVAMTGDQDAAGAMPVPEMTRMLEAEGVKRIIVMTDEPGKYGRAARFGPGVEVWHRDRLDEAQKRLRFTVDRALPEPALKVSRDANVFMMGIGGTGVVTVNQVLGTAALLDGKHVRGLDQTGLSQKGGPVVSHLKISDAPSQVSSK